ncbi:hypothetical protein BH11PSE11_BH11PSE11_36340 [soil metagenome]
MFESNLITYPNVGGAQRYSYGENLGLAARAFIAALLAVDPQDEETIEHPVSERVRLKGIEQLNALASSFDSTMPNQAAELRYLAGCDLPH